MVSVREVKLLFPVGHKAAIGSKGTARRAGL